MLINLHVKNLALIEEAEIDFDHHLNILTGETGAGKSILIGSIQSALGNKIPKDMIRTGCDSALIELVFHTESFAVKEKLEELEIPFEEGDIIIQRRITNQRVLNKVNGVAVTVSKLKEISPLLLDLSGQHENQLLLQPKNHLLIVDNYKKNEINPVKTKVKELYHTYQELLHQWENDQIDSDKRTREIEFLKYEIKEIKSAHLKEGEDEELFAQYQLITHSKDILENCGKIYDLTNGSSGSAGDQIGTSMRYLSEIVSMDSSSLGLSEQLETIDSLLNDFNRELSDYMSSMEFDEETYQTISKRLDQINHLKTKYGDTIEKILEYRDRSLERYEKLIHFEEYILELEIKVKKAKQDLYKAAEELTALRRKVAAPLTEEIKSALKSLNFNDVQFEINIQEKNACQADGKDSVCFMISTNPGLPIAPLHEIASGGELSRIMLAIKSILADEEQIETLIFDEIDTGISGRTAQKVSERLAKMGKNRQVIAITHLPQIAAMANSHYLIEKTSDSYSTISSIHKLSEEESICELARMLGGAQITNAVLENAKEMKNFCKQNLSV